MHVYPSFKRKSEADYSFFLRLFEDTADDGTYLLVCLGPEDIRVYRKIPASVP